MNSGDDPAQNIAAAENLLREAADGGAVLAVLPEMYSCIGSASAMRKALQWPGAAAALERLQTLAHNCGLWIVGGTLPWCDTQPQAGLKPGSKAGKPCARSFVVNAQGELVAHYDKIHLFDVEVGDSQGSYRESDSYTAGELPVLVETPVGKLGLAVCYDLRFPELFRVLWQQGAEVFALPSAFTALTGAAHWEVLLRARAIENGAYLLAANQAGVHADGRETWGHSAIVDPWGVIRWCEGAGACVLAQNIDLEKLHATRARMPCAQHQKIRI